MLIRSSVFVVFARTGRGLIFSFLTSPAVLPLSSKLRHPLGHCGGTSPPCTGGSTPEAAPCGTRPAHCEPGGAHRMLKRATSSQSASWKRSVKSRSPSRCGPLGLDPLQPASSPLSPPAFVGLARGGHSCAHGARWCCRGAPFKEGTRHNGGHLSSGASRFRCAAVASHRASLGQPHEYRSRRRRRVHVHGTDFDRLHPSKRGPAVAGRGFLQVCVLAAREA